MPYLGRCTIWPALGVTIECIPSGEESALGEVFGDIFEDELLMKIFDDGKDGIIGTPQAILARASVPPNSSALELSERDYIASEVLTEGDFIESKEVLPNWVINRDIDVSVT
jgi:hypothetical protein